jgi:hypothetical protein
MRPTPVDRGARPPASAAQYPRILDIALDVFEVDVLAHSLSFSEFRVRLLKRIIRLRCASVVRT